MDEKTNDNDLIGEFDAMKWAERFVNAAKGNPEIPYDEGTMLTWFSCAIMAGYDWRRNKPAPSPSEWQSGITDDTPCFVSGCDYTDIDVRGPIALRDDSTHYYACTEHWEAIVGILGRQVNRDDEQHVTPA